MVKGPGMVENPNESLPGQIYLNRTLQEPNQRSSGEEIRELLQKLSMLSQQQTSSNWVKTLPLAVCILTEQCIGKSGKNPAELFQN